MGLSEYLEQYRRYDPASRSRSEIFFLYPGPKAVGLYRMANALERRGVPFVPRLISETARWLTGIEIHPAATIGKNLMIDHGHGVVIGETAVVGDNVLLYQGVTLGGTHVRREKRHPTVEDNVVVGAGAKILGKITVGEGSRVGANSVVIDDVPAHSTVVGIPAKTVVKEGIRPGEELRHDRIQESGE